MGHSSVFRNFIPVSPSKIRTQNDGGRLRVSGRARAWVRGRGRVAQANRACRATNRCHGSVFGTGSFRVFGAHVLCFFFPLFMKCCATNEVTFFSTRRWFASWSVRVRAGRVVASVPV